MWISPHAEEFFGCLAPLLASKEVNAMRRWRHHFSVTCYEHSLFVAYMAYRIAQRDPADRNAHPGNQCLDHPVFALRNAQALCPDLSEGEANAIVSHMFPLAVHLPRSRVAIAVNLADKLCATIEVAQLYRIIPLRRRLMARVGCC